jgi:hypothetical protein
MLWVQEGPNVYEDDIVVVADTLEPEDTLCVSFYNSRVPAL